MKQYGQEESVICLEELESGRLINFIICRL